MRKTLTFLILFLAAACTTIPAPVAMRIAQPVTPATRNFTSFDGALRCMDNLFSQTNHARVLVSSTGFPDQTKLVNVSADDMLIGAINGMNRKSNSFAFLDQAREVASGQIKYLTESSKLKPKIYVRGAISQFDKATVTASDSAGFGSSTAAVSGALQMFNISRSRILSIVTVDMHLVSNPGRIVLPGMSVSNSMVIVKNTFGGSATGLVSLTPISPALSIDRVESSGQAVRNLIELGAIELLGKYARVPYWTCLGSPSTDQKTRNSVQEKFARSGDSARISSVQLHLESLALLENYTPGKLDRQTKAAIGKFQAKNGLIANGQIDNDLVRRLTAATSRLASPAALGLNGDTHLAKLTVGRRKNGALQVGQSLQIVVRSLGDAYVNCYHQTTAGAVTRIFPVRQNQSNLLKVGQSVALPGAAGRFQIVMEGRKTEEILCIAENQDFGALFPPEIGQYDLSPLSAPNLQAVLQFHQRLGLGQETHQFANFRSTF